MFCNALTLIRSDLRILDELATKSRVIDFDGSVARQPVFRLRP